MSRNESITSRLVWIIWKYINPGFFVFIWIYTLFQLILVYSNGLQDLNILRLVGYFVVGLFVTAVFMIPTVLIKFVSMTDECLIVESYLQQIRLQYSDILEVSGPDYSTLNLVKLSLSYESKFGRKIYFPVPIFQGIRIANKIKILVDDAT